MDDVVVGEPFERGSRGPKRGLKNLLLLLIRLCHEAEQGDPGAPGQETQSKKTYKSHCEYGGSCIQSNELGANPVPQVKTKEWQRWGQHTNWYRMTVKHVLVSSLYRDKREGDMVIIDCPINRCKMNSCFPASQVITQEGDGHEYYRPKSRRTEVLIPPGYPTDEGLTDDEDV